MKTVICQSKQSGAVLFVALVFLILLTIISLSAVNTSMTGQKIAANVQYQTEAFEYAQSVMDGILNLSDPFQDEAQNKAYCYNKTEDYYGNTCVTVGKFEGFEDGSGSVIGNDDINGVDFSNYINASVTQLNSYNCPGSSIGTFLCINFVARTEYDNSNNGFGRAQIVQGFQLQSSAPTAGGSLHDTGEGLDNI